MNKINLILPMNGLGNRFKDDDYHVPKPLINVLGKPMIFWLLDNLSLDRVNQIIIPYTTSLDNFNFQGRLREKYQNIEFKFFPLSSNTKGAAETVYLALELLDDEILSHNTILMDCDTFYFDDVIERYQNHKFKNTIFYFDDQQDYPIYSYIKINELGLVTDIKEKVKISNQANCGIYGFENAHLLKEYCSRTLESNLSVRGEYYISSIYELMLKNNIEIGSEKITNFNCVGTPMQLKIFCETHQSDPERFCFDIDGTLVTKPQIENDYTTCEPIEKNINFLRHLKNLGHYIILHTARRMRTHNGNVGRVIQDIGLITQEQLKKFNIPYDELVFGKPYASFYIDDRAINCESSLEKQLGYYNSTIKSRSFNEIEILDSMVIKSGRIEGEKFFYRYLDKLPEVADIFPRFLDYSKDKIIIERVKGLNFSYLYSNNSLTDSQFNLLLNTLRRLHSNALSDITIETVIEHNIQKIQQRYKSYDYNKFFEAKKTYTKILDFLNNYRPTSINVIHGDPVFTNIIITDLNQIKLIDMRGQVGNIYTVCGDPIYDLSKIYQSLTGYDHILNGKEYRQNKKLLQQFDNFINEYYQIDLLQIKKFTSNLYFSLIPLHNNEKCELYYQMARQLIQ